MGFLLLIYAAIGLAVTRAAWEWNPLVGIVVGFMFVGGMAAKIAGGFVTMIWAWLNYLLRPGMYRKSKEFIAAWEARFGPMRRGVPETQPPPGLFPAYYRMWKRTGMTPTEFLSTVRW